MKRATAVLLVLCMMCGLFGIFSFADGELGENQSMQLSSDTVNAYYQTREKANLTEDVRIILVADEAFLSTKDGIFVTITFELTVGGTKSITTSITSEANDYTSVFRSITAGDETYTAATGDVIFGNIITGIPLYSYTGVNVTVKDQDESIIFSGSNNIDVFSAENGNLALNKAVSSSFAHSDPNWSWDQTLVNDGNLNQLTTENGNGGYHGHYANRSDYSDWVAIGFDEAVTFNTVAIYPCKESNTTSTLCPGMPNAFRIETSDDGETWTTVHEEYCYDIPEFGAQVFSFDAVTAEYVRFYCINPSYSDVSNSYAMKICEFAVYNREGYTAPQAGNINLLEGVDVIPSSTHTDGPWNVANINDGDKYNFVYTAFDWGQFAGYHSAPGTTGDITLDFNFGETTEFNKVVIIPSTEKYSVKHPENSGKFYVPANIEIYVSDDGVTWGEAVVSRTDCNVSEYDSVEFSFDTQNAQYVRVLLKSVTDYVKLSEIEAYMIQD